MGGCSTVNFFHPRARGKRFEYPLIRIFPSRRLDKIPKRSRKGETLVEKNRVALLAPYPPIRDGIAFYSNQLSEALQSIGENVCVLTWANTSDVRADQKQVKVVKVSSPTRLSFKSSVTGALTRLSPDLVHVQYSFKRGLYGWALGEQLFPVLFTIQKLGIPIVMTIHDIWSRDDVLAKFGKNILTIPKAVAYYAYLRWVAKFLLRQVNAVIVHSKYFANLLNKEYNVNREKLFVLNHGITNYQSVDNKKAKLKIQLPTKRILLSFGVIWEGKRLEYLIEVMKHVVEEIPNIHLVIAGPPSPTNGAQYVDKLRRLTKEVGLEQHISIHAEFIEENRIPFYFSAASLVVIPYPYSTGASGVMTLAFAFERPVVASLNPLRIDELGLGNNAKGIFAPLDDPHQFAQAVIRLLRDDELYEKLKQNIKIHKIESSWKTVAIQSSKIYEKVLQSQEFGRK